MVPFNITGGTSWACPGAAGLVSLSLSLCALRMMIFFSFLLYFYVSPHGGEICFLPE